LGDAKTIPADDADYQTKLQAVADARAVKKDADAGFDAAKAVLVDSQNQVAQPAKTVAQAPGP
jgi:hypothetical protein